MSAHQKQTFHPILDIQRFVIILLHSSMITSIFPQTDSIPNTKSARQVRYPQDIQIIIRSDTPSHGNLFLSNLEAAENPHLLQKLQITAVITATKGQHLQHPKNIVQFSKYIPLDDDQKCEIYEFLDETVSFIHQKLKITNVLVHCVSGISKSAAFAIAYIMKNRHLTLQDAFNEVKSRRRIIAPHRRILMQLKKYEIHLLQKFDLNRIETEAGQPKENLNNLTARTSKVSNLSPADKFKRKQSKELKMDLTDREKTIQQKSKQQSPKVSEKMLSVDFDEVKSTKSYHSNNSRRNKQASLQGNNTKLQIRNPQQSIISNQSQQKSIVDRSFAKSRARSEHSLSQLLLQQVPDSPILTKKASSSRQEFAKKMKKVDSRNEEINFKIDKVQERFQNENKAHRQNLDMELSEIYQMKNQVYTHQSERKSKLATKKSLHSSTMQDPQIMNYIYNLPN